MTDAAGQTGLLKEIMQNEVSSSYKQGVIDQKEKSLSSILLSVYSLILGSKEEDDIRLFNAIKRHSSFRNEMERMLIVAERVEQ